MVNLCSPSPSLWIGGAQPDRERHKNVGIVSKEVFEANPVLT